MRHTVPDRLCTGEDNRCIRKYHSTEMNQSKKSSWKIQNLEAPCGLGVILRDGGGWVAKIGDNRWWEQKQVESDCEGPCTPLGSLRVIW